jgi:hypothetical protein
VGHEERALGVTGYGNWHEKLAAQAADTLDEDHGLPQAQPDTEEQQAKEKR